MYVRKRQVCYCGERFVSDVMLCSKKKEKKKQNRINHLQHTPFISYIQYILKVKNIIKLSLKKIHGRKRERDLVKSEICVHSLYHTFYTLSHQKSQDKYIFNRCKTASRVYTTVNLRGIGVAMLSADCASLDFVRTVTHCGLMPTSFVMSIKA